MYFSQWSEKRWLLIAIRMNDENDEWEWGKRRKRCAQFTPMISSLSTNSSSSAIRGGLWVLCGLHTTSLPKPKQEADTTPFLWSNYLTHKVVGRSEGHLNGFQLPSLYAPRMGPEFLGVTYTPISQRTMSIHLHYLYITLGWSGIMA